MTSGAVTIRAAVAGDDAAVAALLDVAFGPARQARTASLLRIGATPLATSVVAQASDGDLFGSIQFWPVALIAGAQVVPLTLLGPMAVAPAVQGQGLGRRLLAAALARADAAGHDPILLIGDLSYYGRFGFSADATGKWRLPGPVERERLLLRQRTARTLPSDGIVRPWAVTDA